jgi:hypothetical protein
MTATAEVSFDLAKWGRGEIEYPLEDVRNAIEVTLGRRDVRDASSAVVILIEAGIVKPGKVRLNVGLAGEEDRLWRLFLVGEGLISPEEAGVVQKNPSTDGRVSANCR